MLREGYVDSVIVEGSMATESRCPNCGAELPRPGQPCPFCAAAQQLLRRLAEEEEVRLCGRCGAVLEPGDEELCSSCRQVAASSPGLFARRDDRIASWIRDRFVEPVAERQGITCPACGVGVSPLARFCSQCGFRLAEVSPGDAADAAGLAAPVPGAEGAVADLEAGPAAPVEAGPGAGPPSRWRQFIGFWRDQFRPRGPVLDQPRRTWGQRVAETVRGLLGLGQDSSAVDAWLIILVGLLLVGLVGLLIFLAQLLGSGDVFFR